jgi:anti-sigma regulatory factor (Ser/Thr protein kinase)
VTLDVRPHPASRDHALVHDALVFADPASFLSVAVPFLREGIAAREIVFAVTSPANHARLVEALGDDAAHVEFGDPDRFFPRPGSTFATYRTFIDERLSDGAHARVLAEAVWAGRDADEVGEWVRFESTVNVVFADAPLQVVCCYDDAQIPAWVTDTVAQTHPTVCHGGRWDASAAYVEPERFIEELERCLDLPQPPAGAAALSVDSDLRQLRRLLRGEAERAGLDGDKADDVLLAVTELVTNLIRHSSGVGELLAWGEDGRFACELRDASGSRPPALAGYTALEVGQEGGWGLALVRQLADLVQVSGADAGSAIRLTFEAA